MSMIYELQSYELLSTKHHITLLIFINCILFCYLFGRFNK